MKNPFLPMDTFQAYFQYHLRYFLNCSHNLYHNDWYLIFKGRDFLDSKFVLNFFLRLDYSIC